MLTKDEAICIRAVDYSETSQIATFFTKTTGKITAIAKGSKRPRSSFDGPIEVLAHGIIVFSDRARDRLATVTEFEQQPGLRQLSGNLFGLNCCLFAAELLNSLTDDYDPHPALFDSFLRFLHDSDEARPPGNVRRQVLALLILYQLVLLKEIGLQPILDHCGNCKTAYEADWPQVYFSTSAHGLICRDCENSLPDKIKLTKSVTNCLSNLKLIASANEKTLNEIERVLIYHFTELLGRAPKMAKYILKN